MSIELNVLNSGTLDKANLIKTPIPLWISDEKLTIVINVYSKQPLNRYKHLPLEIENATITDSVETRGMAIEETAEIQRYLYLLDNIEFTTLNPRQFKVYRDDELCPMVDRDFYLTRGKSLKDVVLFDSVYNDRILPSDWTTVLLPRHCDPYYPGRTIPRLSKHRTSEVDLCKLAEEFKAKFDFKFELGDVDNVKLYVEPEILVESVSGFDQC